MEQDEIIEMARQADLDWHKGWTLEDGEPNRFEAFAKLVAAKERDGIVQAINNLMSELDQFPQTATTKLAISIIRNVSNDLIELIQERGEA